MVSAIAIAAQLNTMVCSLQGRSSGLPYRIKYQFDGNF